MENPLHNILEECAIPDCLDFPTPGDYTPSEHGMPYAVSPDCKGKKPDAITLLEVSRDYVSAVMAEAAVRQDFGLLAACVEYKSMEACLMAVMADPEGIASEAKSLGKSVVGEMLQAITLNAMYIGKYFNIISNAAAARREEYAQQQKQKADAESAKQAEMN